MPAIQTHPQSIPLTKQVISPQLELTVGCDLNFESFALHQFAAYPFRLSRCFHFDQDAPRRAYFYLMNAAPGLFANDNLEMKVQLNDHSQLYLTDQAALKIHSMHTPGSFAQVIQRIGVGKNACLEYVPEPIILYRDADLHQRSDITLHPTAQMFWSEIVLPGRLASDEWYDFRQYRNRLQVHAVDGALLFCDAMMLAGQENPFNALSLFCSLPIIGNIVTVLPEVNLTHLTTILSNIQPSVHLQASFSPLPNCNGLLIRAIADSTSSLKAYIRFALNHIRQLTQQPPLPEVPK